MVGKLVLSQKIGVRFPYPSPVRKNFDRRHSLPEKWRVHMRKQNLNAKPQTRTITKGVTLTGTWSVDQWDEQLRKEVAARAESEYRKEVIFTPEFSVENVGGITRVK